MKNFFFQIVHLWIVFSICLTSYDAHMPTVKREFEAVMFPGRNGIQDINRYNCSFVFDTAEKVSS